MYTSYSTLQRKQLSKQVYTDTQSTYLLVKRRCKTSCTASSVW